MTQPRNFRGLMVSSTFADLREHRAEVISLVEKLGFKAVVMEHSSAQSADLITSSLDMVNDCAGYILLISHKYGQIPTDPRNPDALSITELEFNEAVRLKRPRLLFVMAEDHPVTKPDIESDPDKQSKLEAFKARAKLMNPDDSGSDVSCVYAEFSSPANLAKEAAVAIANLAKALSFSSAMAPLPAAAREGPADPPLPAPPALRALPDYIGSHAFLGRASELQTLDDWAAPADPNPILLFEAMGGSGKSILTWQWLNRKAPELRDWAGRFWYSFYERGATMADFCRQALAYITGQPVEHFLRMRMSALSDRLVRELQARSWLLVLDGLERILVQYNRIDAAQMKDAEADSGIDPIANRDPCQAIRPEDDDLLRRLTTVSPSKLLISTRLLPLGLANRAGAALPGVKRELLGGLRPGDAEDMFRMCGVHGDSAAIRAFLQANCDCHPLVVGGLAGLVNDYLPDKGDFDRWADDPAYGGALNLAELDLRARQDHILEAAVAALAPEGRRLLQMLALLLGGAEYAVLEAFNPHLPQPPPKAELPGDPRNSDLWDEWDEQEQAERLRTFEAAQAEDATYPAKLAAWQANPEVKAAPARLRNTVRDLERRGLLQYDGASHRYDLHPVVRGITSGRMSRDERTRSGAVVVDYFSAKTPDNWSDATTLDDVETGIQLVTTLIEMEQYNRAFDVFGAGLNTVIIQNIEDIYLAFSILKGWFVDGWSNLPKLEDEIEQSRIMTFSAEAAYFIDKDIAKSLRESVIYLDLKLNMRGYLCQDIIDICEHNGFSKSIYLAKLAEELAITINTDDQLFNYLKFQLNLATDLSDADMFESIWLKLLDIDGSDIDAIRPGMAETIYARYRLQRGTLTDEVLIEAEELARRRNSRNCVRNLAQLRGRWLLEMGDHKGAVPHLSRAVSMAREVRRADEVAEAALALARARDADEAEARNEAERLDAPEGPANFYLAELWRELGEPQRAIAAARRAHQWGVGDGEPWVRRWALERARALLTDLGAELPSVPVYDSASETSYPWEADVRAMIEGRKA